MNLKEVVGIAEEQKIGTEIYWTPLQQESLKKLLFEQAKDNSSQESDEPGLAAAIVLEEECKSAPAIEIEKSRPSDHEVDNTEAFIFTVPITTLSRPILEDKSYTKLRELFAHANTFEWDLL